MPSGRRSFAEISAAAARAPEEFWAAAAQEMKIPANGIVDTGVRVITPQNIAEFRKELKDLGVTSS